MIILVNNKTGYFDGYNLKDGEANRTMIGKLKNTYKNDGMIILIKKY